MVESEIRELCLYIKQLLCTLQITRLNRIVKINDIETNEVELKKELHNLMLKLKDEFTIPETTIRLDRSVVDMSELLIELVELLDHKEQNKYGTSANKLFREPLCIDHIYRLPNLSIIYNKARNTFKERNKYFSDSRITISQIVNKLDIIYDTVNSFIQTSETTIPLGRVITYINLIAIVDYAFTISEIGESVFDEVKND